MLQQLQAFDWQFLWLIQKIQSPFLDFWIPKLTALGNGGILWIILALVLLLIPKTRRCGISLVIALLLVFLLGNCLLKPLLARPRPFMQSADVTLLIPPPSDFSFPSGHTYSGIAAAIVIWYYHRRWGIAAMILALLIAFSRLYLMVHFPSDILGGILLGIFCAITAITFTNKKLLK